MKHIHRSAEAWVKASAKARMRESLVIAGSYVLIAFAGLVLWFGLVFGLMFIFSFLLIVFGIGLSVNYVFVVWGLQLVLYPLVRRKEGGNWEVAQDVDDNVHVIKPDVETKEDTAFTNRGIVAGLFFAVPLAIDESWRQVQRAWRAQKVEREPLATVVAILMKEQRKMTFQELGETVGNDTLYRAMKAARIVPGFQFFGNEPQGVALNTSALEEALAISGTDGSNRRGNVR